MKLVAYMIIALADLSGAPAPAPDAYAEFRRNVAAGASGVLFVGRPVPADFSEYRITLSVDSLDGFAPGVYDCYPAGGRAMIAPRPAPAPVRAVLRALSPCANGRCPK